jgi:hypothetical protein
MTAPPLQGVENFVPTVMGGLENVAIMHHCHTPGIILHGAGHYHGTYEKCDGRWQIETRHLTEPS